MKVHAEERPFLLIALAAAILSALLMGHRLGAPVGGYLVFNEGFYLLNAMREAERGILEGIVRPLDANNPFLYSWLLSLLVRAFGVSTLAARGLSVFASVGAVLLTYLIGKRLYAPSIGALAAVFVACAPGFVLVGRNIQIDSLMLFVMLASLYALLRASAEGDARWGRAAGALVAIGALLKLPSLFAPAAFAVWATWRHRGLSWLREPWVRPAAIVAAGLVGGWYGLRAVSSGGASVGAQLSIVAAAASRRPLLEAPGYVAGEVFWMLGPPLAAAAVLGLVLAARRRQPADTVMIVWVAVHGLAFLVFNYHSYYFVPLIPAAALLAARGVHGAGVRSLRPVLAASIVAMLVLSPIAAFMLAEKKHTMVDANQIPFAIEAAGFDRGATVLSVHDRYWGGFGPAVELAGVQGGIAMVRPYGGAVSPSAPEGLREVRLGWADEEADATLIAPLGLTLSAPVAFGYAVIPQPPYRQGDFAMARPAIERVGPVSQFGWVESSSQAAGWVLVTDP